MNINYGPRALAAMRSLPAQTESQGAYAAAGGDLAMATVLRWGIPVRPHRPRPRYAPNRADRRRALRGTGAYGVYTRSLVIRPEVTE